MSNLDIKDVFEKERFPKSNWQFVSLLLYSPVGLILALLRFFIGFQACLAGVLLSHLPAIRSFVLRILCFVLGIYVEEDNKCNRSRTCKLLVANCVSQIDYIPLHLITGCVSPSGNQTSLTSLVPGLKDFSDDNRSFSGMRSFIEKGPIPLFLQPEETTSGKNTLLKFTGLPAGLSKEVQPVTLKVERPSWANTAPTCLGASLPVDIFWFLFTPTTAFKIKYLNVIHRQEGESDEDFVNRIEAAIANALSYQTSSFTAKDKAEYEKRYLDELGLELAGRGSLSVATVPVELQLMTEQVAEVLMHVPRDVILRDLMRTRNVDATISNILEGSVQYEPVREPSRLGSVAGPSVSSASATGSSPNITTHDPVFLKSSQDRMMSLAEMKVKMIADARRRYIEKKGIKLNEL